jgi:hypothetical protein
MHVDALEAACGPRYGLLPAAMLRIVVRDFENSISNMASAMIAGRTACSKSGR